MGGVTPASLIIFAMAVGLFVDYAAHIVFTYYETPYDLTYRAAELLHFQAQEGGKKRPLMAFCHPASTQRMVHAMVEMGPNVLAGGFSTFLGTCWLAFCSSEIFRTFFRMMFATIVWGVVFGMVFIPVVISFHVPAEPEPIGEEEIEELKLAEAEKKDKFARLDAKRIKALGAGGEPSDSVAQKLKAANGEDSHFVAGDSEPEAEADAKAVTQCTSVRDA